MAITLSPVVSDRIPFQSLDVHVAARELAARAHALPLPDAELHDQLRRASKSAFLNLAEGLPADSAGLRRRALGRQPLRGGRGARLGKRHRPD